MKTRLVLIAIMLSLGGCITTQEMPLAPNMVRIDTNARGALFASQAVPQTMRAAAQSTLERGYTHFRLVDASMAQGVVPVGTVTTTTGSFGGTDAGPFVSGSFSSVSSSDIVSTRASRSAATVVMFHGNEPEAQGAFDAAQVLKQYQ